jgi:hypothetical protein
MTWDYYPACLWSMVEVTVGLMCACFPAVRQLLVKACPRLGDSVPTHQNGYWTHRSTSKAIASNQPGTRTTILVDSKAHRPGPYESGIMVERSYHVL